MIGGWALAYAVDTAREGSAGSSAQAVQERYDALLASPLRMGLWHTAFMAATAGVVARGIAGGIEKASKILMPVLMALVALLALYSALEGDLQAGLHFLFAVDWKHVSPDVALEALGLGFFSIGVGLSVMITYAAYAGTEIDLRSVALATILGDTAVSFMAGIAVFPVVFAEKLDPAGGAGLMFVTLPLAFARMPLGTVMDIAFFVLLAVAGLESAISMLEMPVALLQRSLGWRRSVATLVAASASWTLGFISVLSFNWWAKWFPLGSLSAFAKATAFDLLDYLTSNMLLPACGFALCIFGGWLIPARILAEELRLGATATALLRFLLRYIAPLGIAAASLAPLTR